MLEGGDQRVSPLYPVEVPVQHHFAFNVFHITFQVGVESPASHLINNAEPQHLIDDQLCDLQIQLYAFRFINH